WPERDAMPIQVLMPALSPTMEEGKLAKWLKAEGDAVKPGDVIAEIETDKATMEVEAADEGVLGKILVAAGTEGVKVNTPIALLLGEGEDKTALEKATPEKTAPAPKSGNGSAPQTATEPAKEEAKEKPAAKAREPDAKPAPAPPPKPKATVPGEKEYSGPTQTQTVREALRDAMAEEMRRATT